jgi:hypothetical protein
MPIASTSRAAPLILLTLSLLAAGCGKPPPAPPPPPAPAPLTEWPKGVSAPLKITDQLTLAIPLQYERTAIEPGEPRLRAFLTQQSDRAEARFDFFLPAFSGYTLENYRNENDPDKVGVAYLHAANPHEADPDSPGEYPPNMLKRALAESLNPNDHLDQYGLRCYRGREPSARLTCYGRRNAAGEYLMLSTLEPPYPADSFPQLQARYFSRNYGGVRIAWRTPVRNLPRWRQIDAQIWTFIEAWKIAPPAAPAAPRP